MRCRCRAVLASAMQEDSNHEVSISYSSSRIGNPEEPKSDKENFGSGCLARESSLGS